MIHMRKKWMLAILLAVLMVTACSAALAQSCRVNATKLILREEPNSTSKALQTLPQGTKLEIIKKEGHWYQVTYGKLTGYVYDVYVTLNDTVKDDGILQKGEKGEAIKEVQLRLKELGYYKSTCDGSFGAVTENAVKAFQKKNGLTDDGMVGETTLKKLNSTSAIAANGKPADSASKIETADSVLRKGAKGDAVKKLQLRLKELGYYKSTCDGSYGDVTVVAVKAFQKKNSLPQDGVAGETTLKKLYAATAIGANDKTESNKDDGTLKQGSSGTAVKLLQQRLKELGYYNYTCDSSYGYRTVQAVKAFQKRNGLTANGIADAATQKKLNSTSAVPAKDEPTAAPPKDDTLKEGSKGDAVKKLQQRLKDLGYYNYTCDSSYGYRTVEAVKAFQKRNGLTVDGVAGESTLKKLNSSSAVPAKDAPTAAPSKDDTLRVGSKGDAVKKVQQRLKELGYYSYGCDGNYGERTATAVKAFQKMNGLTQDGVVGKTTLNKLNSTSAIPAKGADVSLNSNQTLQRGDSGAQVKALQKRLKELGYYTSSLDSDYGLRTATAVSNFQRANGLTVNGIANSTTIKKMLSSSAVTKAEADKKEQEQNKIKTENLDWFKNGKAVFAGRPVIQVKDVRTGLVFKAKVLFGTNHLDVEPLTKADTAILLKINGGVDFSWRRRPMLVKHNGHVYASSIYSEPHGEQTILDNNFDGQFCLHFYGSKTHGTEEVKQDHQNCIAEALKATW